MDRRIYRSCGMILTDKEAIFMKKSILLISLMTQSYAHAE